MCPERQVLSAYVDGEIPSPWREKIDRHAAVCGSCAALIASYSRVSSVLQNDHPPGMDAAMERVRTGVYLHAYTGFGSTLTRIMAVVSRRISVPVPLAAAVFLFIFVLGFALVSSKPGADPSAFATLPADPAQQLSVTIKVDDVQQLLHMEQLLHLLASQDRFREVTIRLPESASTARWVPPIPEDFDDRKLTIELPDSQRFNLVGEPQFLRAADYHRSVNK